MGLVDLIGWNRVPRVETAPLPERLPVPHAPQAAYDEIGAAQAKAKNLYLAHLVMQQEGVSFLPDEYAKALARLESEHADAGLKWRPELTLYEAEVERFDQNCVERQEIAVLNSAAVHEREIPALKRANTRIVRTGIAGFLIGFAVAMYSPKSDVRMSAAAAELLLLGAGIARVKHNNSRLNGLYREHGRQPLRPEPANTGYLVIEITER